MHRHAQFTCNFQVLSVKAYGFVNKRYISISKFRFIVQIYSSSWVLFTVLFIFYFFKKEALWPLLMDGIQMPQGYTATTRRHLTFYHYATIDLKFPKKTCCQLFFNSHILVANSDMFWRDLVPFTQFKKLKKY